MYVIVRLEDASVWRANDFSKVKEFAKSDDYVVIDNTRSTGPRVLNLDGSSSDIPEFESLFQIAPGQEELP
jgi:hypothetical protein